MALRWRAGPALGALALLGACAAGPNYRAPPVTALGVPESYATPASAEAPADLAAFWTRFDDPLLTSLIERAAAGNLDIARARGRLVQAREALVQAGADQLPLLSGSAGANRTETRVPVLGRSGLTQLSLGLDASWQADLFGGTRRSVEAARAEAAASGYDLEAVRTATAGEVATNYINARLAQARLAIAADTLKNQDDNLQIAGWRVQAGLVSSLDAEQARTQRAQTAASIPALQTAYAAAVNRLGVLTGQAPGALKAEMDAAAPIPLGPDDIAVGIPADTLRRRPDVLSAERRLAAATARIGVAKAALYPSLSIRGSFSAAGAAPGSVADTLTGSLFAGLTQVIFDGGRLRSQVRSARAGADIAFADYKGVVLGGLEEVENAIQALDAAKRRQAALAEALDAAQTTALYARSQYRAGLTDFLTLLQSEQALLSSRDALAAAHADQALAVVRLYLALGGGWQASTAPRSDPAP